MILLPLFFTLCVSLSNGAENCDYEWTVINDFEEWEYLHDLYGVKGTPQTTNGFTVLSEKKVIVLQDRHTIKTMTHETGHVLCHIEHPLDISCHYKLDKENIMQQSTRETHKTPEPPEISRKLTESTHGKQIELMNNNYS